jgi:glycosyltransferase involved in cell wall biosynthesis
MTSILTVSEIFWPEGGGAERATYLILKLLAQKGFKITIVTGTDSPAMIPEVKYYVTGYLKSSNRLTRWTLARLLATSHAFIKLLKEHDVLYIPLAAYPLIPIAKKAGLRVVVHLHNYMPIRYNGVKYFFEPDIVSLSKELKLAVFHEFHVRKSLLRTLLSPLSLIGYALSKGWLTKADKIICVSKRQAELVLKNYPQLAGKIEVIYNLIPAELMSAEPRKNFNNLPTFLYASGDSYIKGFYILLYILKKLKDENVMVKFLLLGNYNKHSIKILREIGTGKNLDLNIMGHVSPEKVIKLHKEAWALLFPSLTEEPFPYTVAEASLLGTLPIVPKTCGILEILQGTPAEKYMFNLRNAKEVSEKVNTIVAGEVDEFMKEGMMLRSALLNFFKDSNDKSLKKLVRIFTCI